MDRSLVGALIALHLLVQLLVPAEYYLFREDVLDERFAWRMFSELSLSRRTVRYVAVVRARDGDGAEAEVPVDLRQHLPPLYIVALMQGRRAMLLSFGRRLCGDLRDHFREKSDEYDIDTLLLSSTLYHMDGREIVRFDRHRIACADPWERAARR